MEFIVTVPVKGEGEIGECDRLEAVVMFRDIRQNCARSGNVRPVVAGCAGEGIVRTVGYLITCLMVAECDREVCIWCDWVV